MTRNALLGGVGLLLLLAIAWGAGFLWFVQTAEASTAPPPQADGIVVLTGGADRVATGLHLLTDGRAPLLLVSGVAHGAGLADLAHLAGVDPADVAGRVELGRHAGTTHGNALETGEWVQRHGIRRLIVVTASYHMPRALAELGRALPGVALYPAPVQPPALRRSLDEPTLRLLVAEYMKFLATWSGLDALLPSPAEAELPGAHPVARA